MRWLMIFTLGFGAACLGCVYLEPLPLWVYGLVLLAGLLLRKRALAVLLAAGFLCGGLWYALYCAVFLAPAQALDGAVQEASIRASDYSFETAYGMAVDGTVEQEGKTYQVRLYLDPGQPVLPGERLSGTFRFRLTTPGAEQEATYHSGKGIFLLAYQSGDVTRQPGEESWRDTPARLRSRIREILQLTFPEDAYPFAKALLLGDAGDLGYAVDTDFKVSGIRHVVAVSGLHVSILFALVSTLTLRRRLLTALLGFPALALFAALAGFSPSVVRSCIMCALMLLAMVANQEYDGPTALSFAVLVMLLGNPLVVTSVSLQLSVGSVAGIYLFQERIRRFLLSRFRETGGMSLRSRCIRWFVSSLSITFGAMSITTPLCAWYFGMVSLVSPLTNLLALWIISLIFYGILGVCTLYLAVPALAVGLAGIIAWPIRYVLWVAKVMAQLPLSAVYTESVYIVLWLAAAYGLLILFLLSRNPRPALYAGCVSVGLCLCLFASWLEPVTSQVRFTVLDVGQGQCLLFQSGGKQILVDCGGDSDGESADLAAQTLLSQGIGHVDVMILTHLDDDHAGGAENFLSRMEVGLLILPWAHTDLDTGRAQQVIFATRNLELTAGDTRIQVYSPGFPGNDNEMSLCVLFDTEKCDILITGDRSAFAEELLMRRNPLPQVDILVAGHHGASDATGEALLSTVRPEIVCISAGRDNPYGHPAPALLERLSRFGCQIYRTDIQGTITIRR